MLRSTRTTAALIRSLMLGTVATFSTLAASGTLIACDSDSKPEYWVKKLDDHAWRLKAVERLDQFFEDAVTNSKRNLSDPQVTGLLDLMVEPLVKQFTDNYVDIDNAGREQFIKLLAATRDKRAVPAFQKTFEEFAKSGRGGEEIKWASRAIGDMLPQELAPSVLGAFNKLRAASKEGSLVYRDFSEAMVKLKSSSWTTGLIEHLGEEMPQLKTAKDQKNQDKVDDFKNQLFWQVTSAQVLGEIGDPAAVEPLLKVLLDPTKADIHQTAILALVKLGKPGVDRTVQLVNDADPKLAEFALLKVKQATGTQPAAGDKPHVQMAAIILGTAGNKQAGEALVQAASKAKDDPSRAIFASNLAKLPPSDTTIEAFKQVYSQIEDGSVQAALMAESVPSFYDSKLIPWIIESGNNAKGQLLEDIQASAALALIKLMTPETSSTVRDFVNSKGTKLEKDKYKQAQDLLDSCKADLACYVKELESGKNQDSEHQFIGIKAGYVLAMKGDTKTRDELVSVIDEVENAAIAFVAASAIDHLTPNGSAEVADKLDAIVEKNKKAADEQKKLRDNPIRDVSYRIRARAT